MVKIFYAIFLSVVIILGGGVALAAPEIIEASGEYYMDPRLDETPASATARAREEAKRSAAEKAGVYVQSYSRSINAVLDYDEIRTVAAQLLKIESENTAIEVTPDNLLKFTVTIRALIDGSDDAILRTIMLDKKNLEESARQYSQLQKEYDDLKRQMEELRQKYDFSPEPQKTDLKKSVAQNSQNFSAAQELAAGNGFYLRRDYQKALESYSRAAALNPNLAEIYNNRGLAYYHLGRLDKATENFSKALELDARFFQAYNNRGIVSHASGNSALAIQDYTKALQINPAFAHALNNRGNAYAAVGQYQSALNDLQAAAKILADNPEIHNNLGSVYLSMKNYAAAVDECTRAIRLNQNFAAAYYNRALAYSYLGRYADALPDAKKSAELNPADTDSRDLCAQISGRLSR